MFEPGSQIEKYEILTELTEGGMARVFKVKHTLLGSLHALKVLDPKLVQDPELRARFLSEGQIQARLRHPNIVRVTDLIAQPGVAGLVVDFVDGPTLDEVIRNRKRPPTVDEVKALFLPLLEGLGHAHENGVVHRDIKPSNIIIDPGLKGRSAPRILDFGIAKIAGESLGARGGKDKTRTGARMGTLHYMSPEQVEGRADLDARADVFSLAATMFEYISGEVPFDADSDFGVMKRIAEGQPTQIRDLRSDIDSVLEHCLSKGLARDRNIRIQSCVEFADLLGETHVHILTPRPIRGRPDRSASNESSQPAGAASAMTFHAMGLEWTTNPAATQMSWNQATEYASRLGLEGRGWRLPMIHELADLQYAKQLSTDLREIPGISSGWYWSSSPALGDPDAASFLNSGTGLVDYGHRNNLGYVRCVREPASESVRDAAVPRHPREADSDSFVANSATPSEPFWTFPLFGLSLGLLFLFFALLVLSKISDR